MRNLKLVVFIMCGLVLSACDPVIGAAVGTSATVGVAAAKEGGVKRAVTDTSIRLQIHNLWFKHDVDMYRKLDMTVTEGRVLLTGVIETPEARVDAVRLAWQAEGVEQVINEIEIDTREGAKGFVRDSWITTRLRTRIMVDREVQSINYSIDTVAGTVYLMGVAQDQIELERVIDHARNLSYVNNVVSYVRLRGDTPPSLQSTPPSS